ncbi:hypothetical protein SMAC4_09653 [Sordaria macrospora]|nr:hypothetical protein SMAC4_09653 [Sordaria macrospora]
MVTELERHAQSQHKPNLSDASPAPLTQEVPNSQGCIKDTSICACDDHAPSIPSQKTRSSTSSPEDTLSHSYVDLPPSLAGTSFHSDDEAFQPATDNSDYPLRPLIEKWVPDKGVTSTPYINNSPAVRSQSHHQTHHSTRTSRTGCHTKEAIGNTLPARRVIPTAAGRHSTVHGQQPSGSLNPTDVIATSNRLYQPHHEVTADNGTGVLDSAPNISSLGLNPVLSPTGRQSAKPMPPSEDITVGTEDVIEPISFPTPSSHGHTSTISTQSTNSAVPHPDDELVLASESAGEDLSQSTPIPRPTTTCQGAKDKDTGVRMPHDAPV